MTNIVGPVAQDFFFLRLREVCRKTALSRSEIYRRVAQSTFPAPVKLGVRASAWDSREVDSWIVHRIAARDGAKGAGKAKPGMEGLKAKRSKGAKDAV